MQNADLIIANGIILTMDADDTIMYGGSIAVSNGKIVDIGPHEIINKKFRGTEVIDASLSAVLPGFVNTHFHSTQNFMKGTRDDLSLLDWINKISFPRIKVTLDDYRNGMSDIHTLAVMHAGIDLISSGITTTANMEWGMLPDIADAYDLLGIHITNVLTMTDNASWTPKEAIIEEEELFTLADNLITAFSKEGSKVDFAYGIACPNSASEKLILRSREEASRRGSMLHIHLAESKFEYDQFVNNTGSTPTRYLEHLGFWTSDVWAAHCIWLDSEDIDILARHHVGVSHNPKCNMKIASGAAPVAEMRKRGISVGIGIDSCAVSDNTDFFEAMRTAIFLQRLATGDPKAVLGKEALRMATIEGAAALGKDHKTGSLEQGKQADMIMVRLTDVNLRPYNDIVNNLVFAAGSSNISCVIADGEVLMRDGVFTRFDKDAVLDEVESKAAALYRAAGIEIPRHFMIKELKGGIP